MVVLSRVRFVMAVDERSGGEILQKAVQPEEIETMDVVTYRRRVWAAR